MTKDRFVANFKTPNEIFFGVVENVEHNVNRDNKKVTTFLVRHKDPPEFNKQEKYEDNFFGKLELPSARKPEYVKMIEKVKTPIPITALDEEIHHLPMGKFAKDIDVYLIAETNNALLSKIPFIAILLEKDRENEQLKKEIEIMKDQLSKFVNRLPDLANSTLNEIDRENIENAVIREKHIKDMQDPSKALPEQKEDNFLTNNSSGDNNG